MELQYSHSNVDNTGSLDRRRATVDLNPTIAHVLSRDLYKNPIESMFREVLINAVDAHTEAKQDRPVDIHIPTTWDEVFYIRDYGLGLEHESLMDIYLAYGVSTRRTDNERHGGLGLGTKSPLAYASSFSVISYINRKKNSYLIYYDEDNLPCVDFRSSELSEEPSGLKVSLTTTHYDDFKAFLTAAKSILPWIPSDRYNIVNSNVLDVINQDFEEPEMSDFGPISFLPGSGIAIKMGYVVYKVDLNDTLNYFIARGNMLTIQEEEIAVSTILSNICNDRLLLIKSNIGMYPVHPSREHINVTPRAMGTLAKALEEGAKQLFSEEEVDFTTDLYMYKISGFISSAKSNLKIRSRVLTRTYRWSSNCIIPSQTITYGSLLRQCVDSSDNVVFSILTPHDLTDYCGNNRRTFDFPDSFPIETSLILIDETSNTDVVENIKDTAQLYDCTAGLAEYRRELVLANTNKQYGFTSSTPRTVVRSMQDPKHNVLQLKPGCVGLHKVDWASCQHNATTLEALGKKIFLVPTRMGCLKDKIDDQKRVNEYLSLEPTIPVWKRPLFIGLPASKGTKGIEAKFSKLSELPAWLTAHVDTDYYKRRQILATAMLLNKTNNANLEHILVYGPASWLRRLEDIYRKYALDFSGDAVKFSLDPLYAKTETYVKDIKIKFPSCISSNRHYWGADIDAVELEAWAKEVAVFTNNKPTGAKQQ